MHMSFFDWRHRFVALESIENISVGIYENATKRGSFYLKNDSPFYLIVRVVWQSRQPEHPSRALQLESSRIPFKTQ